MSAVSAGRSVDTITPNGYGVSMPFAAALLKLALFVLWACPTYKSTINMLEMRERRLGILPPEARPDEQEAGMPKPNEKTGPKAATRKRSTSLNQARTK